MNELNNLRMRLKETLDILWARVKGMFGELADLPDPEPDGE